MEVKSIQNVSKNVSENCLKFNRFLMPKWCPKWRPRRPGASRICSPLGRFVERKRLFFSFDCIFCSVLEWLRYSIIPFDFPFLPEPKLNLSADAAYHSTLLPPCSLLSPSFDQALRFLPALRHGRCALAYFITILQSAFRDYNGNRVQNLFSSVSL